MTSAEASHENGRVIEDPVLRQRLSFRLARTQPTSHVPPGAVNSENNVNGRCPCTEAGP